MAASRRSRLLILVCLSATFVVPTIALHAQDQPHRKPIKRVAPKYPEELRSQQLGGVVHLKAVIGPDGNVTDVQPISGNPALVNVGIEAVKQWKFEPATKTSTEEIEFYFRPE